MPRVTKAEVLDALDYIAGQLPGYLVCKSRVEALAVQIRHAGLQGDQIPGPSVADAIARDAAYQAEKPAEKPAAAAEINNLLVCLQGMTHGLHRRLEGIDDRLRGLSWQASEVSRMVEDLTADHDEADALDGVEGEDAAAVVEARRSFGRCHVEADCDPARLRDTVEAVELALNNLDGEADGSSLRIVLA
jgi:hypothetical protein